MPNNTLHWADSPRSARLGSRLVSVGVRAYMIRLLIVALFLSSTAAQAEEWKLAWVAPGTNWFIKDGVGELNRQADTLVGTIAGSDRVSKYSVKIKLNKKKAQAIFSVLPSDAEPLQLRGTYDRIEASGTNNCQETIQLFDGQNYVGLSRNATC